jgi:sialate O-acetylesterase
MKNDAMGGVVATAALLSLATGVAHADVTLPALISDGMVLQQKQPVRIYGKASPGEKVSVEIAKQTATATADASGDWLATLQPLNAGGPFTLTITGKNKIVINDVLVGEVWVCSGQSNMEWTLGGLPEAKDEIVHADDNQLRMFTVPKMISRTPQEEIHGGRWDSAIPQVVGGFSAVGYYFGKALRAARKVPIGLIHTSWGGTRIEAWTSKEMLQSIGTPEGEFVALDPNSAPVRALMEVYQNRLAHWKAAGSPQGSFDDPGIAPTAKGWESADLSTSDWQAVRVPGDWDTLGIESLANIDGGVWFRRTFTLPSELQGKDLTLTLGAIDDYDTTFVNGVKVGATGNETPNWWQHHRVYTVPANLLKSGENTLAVRVWDTQFSGGFEGSPDDLRLFAADNPTVFLPLAGEWKFKIENVRPSNPGGPPGENDPNMVTGLYNAMLHPLRKYTIAGALWYQGESNAGNPMAYRKQLPAMISNWRNDFAVGEFPFLIVQLAPFMTIQAQPQESLWAGLREAQWLATTALPHVGTAIITDSGDPVDIHPHRKAPVGERLALLARRIAYGESIDALSPSYKSMKVMGGKTILTFEHVGKGLVAHTTDTAGKAVEAGKVVGFTVAGRDGRFVWADARITGPATVEVWSAQVPEPTAVRFAWADYPVVNLYSQSGLPAAPFRTDRP